MLCLASEGIVPLGFMLCVYWQYSAFSFLVLSLLACNLLKPPTCTKCNSPLAHPSYWSVILFYSDSLLTWSAAAFCSPMLPVAGTYVRLVDVTWPYCTRAFSNGIRWLGTHCSAISVTRHAVAVVLSVLWKQLFLLDAIVLSCMILCLIDRESK